MNVLRVHLKGWTASFRYPGFAVGVHPSLPLPPLSTLYGLLSAARGELVTPRDTGLGFVFHSHGKGTDLETTYELSGTLQAGTNVIRREVLFEPELYLYVTNLSFADAFRQPYYPLVLGRSTELAQIIATEEVTLQKQSNVKLGHSILPFPQMQIYGSVHALPTHFTGDIPRRAVGTRPFLLVEDFQNYTDEVWVDMTQNWGVWIHEAKA
ncbi:MAG: type I-B CRISPR-associated protein Cas5 [Abitibacteriaceae bacterium]|nr:type I-B CRISPR-associated protein Cas5 [Abditibacteriaceae bacterium]